MSDETVTMKIGKPEALVLFELLADFHSQPMLRIADNAERLALVRFHGALEKALVEPFSREYRDILTRAKADLTRQWGDAD